MSRGPVGVTIEEILAQPIPVSTSESFFTQKIYFDGNDIYVCQASPGHDLDESVWQVQKFDTASDISGIYANGNSGFINAATDLATVKGYTYAI